MSIKPPAFVVVDEVETFRQFLSSLRVGEQGYIQRQVAVGYAHIVDISAVIGAEWLESNFEFGQILSGSGDGTNPAKQGKRDRKSTRLNSSHRCISYAVFCLK